MDNRLFDRLQENIPTFNQDIIDGLAYKALRSAKDDVDSMIRTAEKSMPEDFSFVGSTICNPQEAYRVLTMHMNRGNVRSRSVDLARNDLFLVKYSFKLGDEELTDRYLYLPRPKLGGLLAIGDKTFAITPVLGDRCFSVGLDNVFVPLPRAVFTYRRFIHTIDVDGEMVSRLVLWSKLHNRGGSANGGKDSDRITLGKVHTTIAHYLFAKYGLLETFGKFADCHPLLTTEGDFDQFVTENKIDLTKYRQVRSRKIRPDGFKARIPYASIASDLVILVKADEWSLLTENLLCGLFYMVDFYPDHVEIAELLTAWNWKVWMGYVLWGDQLGHGKLVENVDSHLLTLDEYVDDSTRHILKEEEGLIIDNFFDLCVCMMERIEDMIRDRASDIGTMYGKSLLVSRYVLSDINVNIFKAMYEISNDRKKKHTLRDYNMTLGKHFGHATITRLRLVSEKPFVSTVSTPGDNRLFKLGIEVVKQARTTRGGGTSLDPNDPANHIHESKLECGNYLVMPKRYPTADSTINPTVLLDERYTIQRKEHLRELTERVGKIISRN